MRKFSVSVVVREWQGRERKIVNTTVGADGVERTSEKTVSHGPVKQLGPEYVVTADSEETARLAMRGILGEVEGLEVEELDTTPVIPPPVTRGAETKKVA